ncbi:UDP-glycosyltransferase 72E1-like [Pistacia vera]|uniref:UDP-glycosyltransferase 72E1-like n=1 Tax=Pistacia vera TaxID=55513 RepID=UPI001263AD49|nr:UDP-glycosyltransferase 72E1-like [Pistacia vera]
MQITKPHVALLASPGMGHLIPVLELAKRLVTHHNLQVTVFVLATDTSSDHLSQLLNSQNHDFLNIVLLPTTDISGLVDPDASIVTKLVVMMHQSLPALRSTISAMKFRPMALIVDLFGTEAMKVADEFGMLKYVFIASNAWFLAVTIYAPAVDKNELAVHVNQQQVLKIPGCKPVEFQDTLEAFLDPNDPMYDGFLHAGMEISAADGIIVNTWEELEFTTLEALRDNTKLGRIAKAPVYPIGPLVRQAAPQALESKVLDWLDMQPTESVIYVSFGSGGRLPAKQMIELAWGLEQSQQRFIWVVRPPLENDISGSFLTLGKGYDSDGSQDYLPDGFLTRTHNIGLVFPMWAPQAEILQHPSVGGFLSHCGWNSTLESINNGIPMISWPLYAEQKMNATMLTEELGVAVRSKELPSESMVERQEIEMMVRKIMVDKEGHAIRNKVKELKLSAEKASSKGGSSYNSLSQMTKHCQNMLEGKGSRCLVRLHDELRTMEIYATN